MHFEIGTDQLQSELVVDQGLRAKLTTNVTVTKAHSKQSVQCLVYFMGTSEFGKSKVIVTETQLPEVLQPCT